MHQITRYFFLCVICICFVGCESDFEPLVDVPLQISAYGFIEADADTQWVRVAPMRKQLSRVDDFQNHRFTLTMHGEGQHIAFNDTLMISDDGDEMLLFYTTVPIADDTKWTMQIENPDYETAIGEIVVPKKLQEENILVDVPIYFSYVYRQSFYFEGLTDPFILECCYWISRTPSESSVRICDRFDNPVNFVRSERGTLAYFLHSSSKEQILEKNGYNPRSRYYLHATGVRVITSMNDWLHEIPKLGLEGAAAPNVFSNFNNGLGFVGGITPNVGRWDITRENADLARELGWLTIY